MRSARSWIAGRGGEPPLVIAHRGYTDGATENTLAAFARARDAGADGVELDVRLSADGAAVVFHDDDLERLAGRPERVDSLSREELGRVALAKGAAIPGLGEVLAGTEDLLVNVEIKSQRRVRDVASAQALVDAVIREVDALDRGDEGRILISSFDPVALARLRLRRPAWGAALLFHGGQPLPLRRAATARLLRPAALHPHEALASPDAIARWSRRGYRIHPWTVNRADRARTLAAAGAHALITDEPERVRAALA